MFVANKTYMDRATMAVRMHGDVSFSQGGSAYDVLYALQHYGIVPEGAMPAPGTLTGDSLANFGEFFDVMTPYVEAVAKSNAKRFLLPGRAVFRVSSTHISVRLLRSSHIRASSTLHSHSARASA